jgi:polysaccharide biosynthesis/export protein
MTNLLIAVAGWCLLGAAQIQQTEYVIGPQDVLMISVYDQADLTGKFAVENDGTFVFPLIGRVKAAGLSARDVENEIRQRLAARYIKDPQVSVTMELYRSQRIFIMGEVRSAGTYQLSGDMTLIEALARAGSTLTSAGEEVLIVRAREGTKGPVLPEQDSSAEVIRVNLSNLQAGILTQNVQLRDGDTIVVPRAQVVYISGQVKTPGAYAIEKGTTVLQALTLAGGVTDRGTTRGLRIIRTVDAKKRELKVGLDDVVQPGDTIIVRERIF